LVGGGRAETDILEMGVGFEEGEVKRGDLLEEGVLEMARRMERRELEGDRRVGDSGKRSVRARSLMGR
jgi:hypothetical protein